MRAGGREGLTLVEVVVAVVLLTVGLLASVSMVTLAARTLGEARRISLAGAAAESLADSLLRSGGGATSGRREYPWGTLLWEPDGTDGASGAVRIVAAGRGEGADAAETEPAPGTILLELYLRVPAAADPSGSGW